MIMVIGNDHDDYSEGFDPEWNLGGGGKFDKFEIRISSNPNQKHFSSFKCHGKS
jgi:hypothetical protein